MQRHDNEFTIVEDLRAWPALGARSARPVRPVRRVASGNVNDSLSSDTVRRLMLCAAAEIERLRLALIGIREHVRGTEKHPKSVAIIATCDELLGDLAMQRKPTSNSKGKGDS